MELRHLQYFLAVAEELHFGRAAKRLRISQPPLSRQIRQLEEEIGVQLFERTKRKVALTKAGLIFGDEARLILQQVEGAAALARDEGPNPQNRLMVAYSPHNAHMALRSLFAFSQSNPSIRVLLRSLATALQVDAILTGRVDVGFLTLPAHSDELAIETIQRDHLVVAMARKHPLASRRAVPIRALTEEILIIYPRHLNAKRHELITGMCRRSGFSPRIIHEVDSIQVTMELVSEGLGVSVMRPPLFDTLKPGVVLRNLQHSPLLETAVAYRRSDRSSVVHDFVRAAKVVASSNSASREER